jgi:hypothetical protein
MTEYDERYTPHPLKCVYILIVDAFLGLWGCLIKFPVFFGDYLLQMLFGSYLPTSIKQLDNNPEMYNKICFDTIKKRAVQVRFAQQKEQHANSTERAWLIVRYENDTEETFVFAKCQASNIFVCLIMSMFGVYFNELFKYEHLEIPVSTAKVHGIKYTPSRFCLILEDLSQRQVEFPNIWSKFVDKSLGRQVLTTLAQVHAKYWQKKCPGEIWNDANRPYQGIAMGMYTLYNVEHHYKPGLVPDKIHKVFTQALWHWREYRQYLSKSQPRCLCHGDTHMGNFYIEKDGTIGMVDFQVLSEENPIRDVTYFLASSYDPDLLEQDEKYLIGFYLEKLQELGVKNPPKFEEAWFAYRMQLFYAMYAFVFSGGFANLMDSVQTNCGVERIVRVMERVDSTGAFYEMLEGRVQ